VAPKLRSTKLLTFAVWLPTLVPRLSKSVSLPLRKPGNERLALRSYSNQVTL
jgi:hypothetical protein